MVVQWDTFVRCYVFSLGSHRKRKEKKKKEDKLGLVVCARNPGTREAETGRPT